MKLALVQMQVTPKKEDNVKSACQAIFRCAHEGADMVVLPEMFVCAYENAAFLQNAEPAGGYIYRALSKAAQENGVYVVGGSFPEKDGDKLFNTSFVFDKNGVCIARHRKVHLFDIQIEGGQAFCESDTFSAGDDMTVFDTCYGRVGLMICFDVRFGELARKMALNGAKLLLVPGAFNMTTGPMHWDLLLRSRAVDNGVWVAGISPARDEHASYVAYGHSAVVSPWGNEVCRLSSYPERVLLDVDLAECDRMRSQIPVLSARREDVYA